MGKNWMVLLFTAFLEERWSIVKLEGWQMNSSLFFFSIKAMKRNSIIGFLKYIFCRNCAVRNPAETGLDSSSLIHKQVAPLPALALPPYSRVPACRPRPPGPGSCWRWRRGCNRPWTSRKVWIGQQEGITTWPSWWRGEHPCLYCWCLWSYKPTGTPGRTCPSQLPAARSFQPGGFFLPP